MIYILFSEHIKDAYQSNVNGINNVAYNIAKNHIAEVISSLQGHKVLQFCKYSSFLDLKKKNIKLIIIILVIIIVF